MDSADLIARYKQLNINRASEFAEIAYGIDVDDLANGYHDLVQHSPSRHDRGKRYLGERTGISSSGEYSNRGEEHLAMAMYNASQAGRRFSFSGGRSWKCLDYQTPLKAERADKGVGKLDLFSVIDENIPCVVELKVDGSKKRLGDTPLRALLEGFAYCAMVEANALPFAAEAEELHHIKLAPARPALAIMAPDEYWENYLTKTSIGSWVQAMSCLVAKIADTMTMEIHLLALRDAGFEYGLNGAKAQLTGDCEILTLDELLATRSR